MKKLITICMLFAASYSAQAQSAADSRNHEDNDRPRKMAAVPGDAFANTEMTVVDRKVAFTDLPDLPKPIWAIITNGAGEQQAQKRVAPGNSYMDTKWLQKGELYFVTLVYKNKSRKSFVLHL
jgi:hypothetical protein